MRGHRGNIGLHQIGLRRRQLCLFIRHCTRRCAELRNGIVNGHTLLRNVVQRCSQGFCVAHRLRSVYRAGRIIGHQRVERAKNAVRAAAQKNLTSGNIELDLLPIRQSEIVHVFIATVLRDSGRRGCRRREGRRAGLPAGKNILALVAGIRQRLHLVENARNLVPNRFHVARIHGSIVGAGSQRYSLRQLAHHAAQRGISHLKLPRDLVRALGE